MALTLPDDFKEFLRLLNSHCVDYLLIGGFAVSYHGYPRTTNDMDIWVAMSRQNAEKLVAVLSEFGFGTPELTMDLFLTEQKVVRMGVPPMRIEILTSISGVDFAACFQSRIEDNIDGTEVKLINLQDLKVNKLASGRFKDLNDLEHLP